MSEWSMKRFWDKASAAPTHGGFQIELDGRPVKTPAKSALVVPTQALANVIAAEWDAQEGTVDPGLMPQTRLANSAIDKVTTQHGEVAALVADYGGSDLLCYRAEDPQALIARQQAEWDPVLNWAKAQYGIGLVLQSGLMPVLQPQSSLDIMLEKTNAMTAFELTAFHELVSLTGSWLLGYAGFVQAFDQESLWLASLVDELFQEEQWGQDEEAVELRETKRLAFSNAWQFRVNLE